MSQDFKMYLNFPKSGVSQLTWLCTVFPCDPKGFGYRLSMSIPNNLNKHTNTHHKYVDTYIYVGRYVCTYVRMYVCTCVYVCLCVCVYMCVCVSVCLCVCVYVYVCPEKSLSTFFVCHCPVHLADGLVSWRRHLRWWWEMSGVELRSMLLLASDWNPSVEGVG